MKDTAPKYADLLDALKALCGMTHETSGDALKRARALIDRAAQPTDATLEQHAVALGRIGPLGRAISVLQDVLTDIEDWEDKALAEAVADARQGLLMMLEAEKLKRDANPVPRVIASNQGRPQ